MTADTSRPLVLTSSAAYVGFQSLGVSRSVQFSLRLRTRSTAGLVAHCAGRTYPVADRVLLRLSAGRPRLTVDWGGGPLLVQSAVNVSDWAWHSLEVVVEPSSASLFVDGRRFHRRAHFSDASLLDLATEFYVGAVPEEATLSRDGTARGRVRGGSRRAFVGCVDRVRIRGRPESWRTVIASSAHARTECVGDVFACSQSSRCPVTGQTPGRRHHSIDDPHTTSVSVVEGGTAAITTDHVGSISVGTLPQPDIRFRAAAQQLHGRLGIGDRPPETDEDEIAFSFSDIARGRIRYTHDGSETTSDRIRLYVETEDGRDVEEVLPVSVVPSNDPPTLHLPPGDTLTLVANTRMELSGELLSATDPDDVGSSLEFGVYPSTDDAEDCGYFELATASGGVRAKISRFTQRDVASGRVFYVHRGALVHSFLVDATDGKDASGSRRLTVRGLPLTVSPVANTGASVPRGGDVVIGGDALAFTTNAPYLSLDVRYTVVEPPFHGELQKRIRYRAESDDLHDTRMWTVASSFTQTQLDESRVRYVSDEDATASREDYFLFRVAAVGAGQPAESEAEYHFRLTVVDCDVEAANGRPVSVQTPGQDRIVTSGELRYVSSLRRHTPDDVIYRVRTEPRRGDLLVDRKRRGRRKLTSGDSFTQADVDGDRLVYRMSPTTSDTVNDTVELDVRTSCSGRRRHLLSFRYQASTGSVQLINVGLNNVEEGGSATIGPEILNVVVSDARPRRNFDFSVTRPPRHGALQLTLTGSENGAVSKTNATAKFNADDIASGRLRYVHDDSETRNDSFRFTVYETISGVAVPEVLFSGRVWIDVALVNDNVPRRVNEAPLDVVLGAGRRLGPAQLRYVDADVDTDRLDVTWDAERPGGVELVAADDRWTTLYHFTQHDVNTGRVYVRHHSGAENIVVLWVRDAAYASSAINQLAGVA